MEWGGSGVSPGGGNGWNGVSPELLEYFATARPPRLEFPGGVYHVVVRGNERAAVFRDDEDREKYLGRLAPNSAGSGLTPSESKFLRTPRFSVESGSAILGVSTVR